ncbi:proline--tRNA ligase [Candidatus Margulisiibacteriota bacterium]
MRFSSVICPTLKEDPHDADVVSQKLMIRAGLIRKVAAGIYTYLPLGLRIIRKFENIIRAEMNKAGAQEVLMPSIIPSDLWKESGRWGQYGKELLRIKDRHEKEFCYGPTHEEVITDLVKNNIRSYKQLPLNLYQIQTKFRDEIRPRFGLMRGREFGMKDAYSFHMNWDSLIETYDVMKKTYERIFERCGLKAKAVEADSGFIGGSVSAEFMVIAKTGEDEIIECKTCGYTANKEAAKALCPEPAKNKKVKTPAYSLVDTPNVRSIEELEAFFKKPAETFIKTLVYLADDVPVLVLVAGNCEANEVKIIKVLGCEHLYLADEKTIKEVTGAPLGFAGPINLRQDVKILADYSIMGLNDAITGANKKDKHIKHVVVERDLKIKEYYDLRLAVENDPCPNCQKGNITVARGIEVGHIFQLGDKYSEAMNANFLDSDGKEKKYIMGCYGIGIGRTVAAAIEQHHDEDGIIWPMSLAPFHVDLILINSKDEELVRYAEGLYEQMIKNKIEVIYDEREESVGRKFKDADLIGFPIKVIVGRKMKEEGLIEIKTRATKEAILVNYNEVLKNVNQIITDGS